MANNHFLATLYGEVYTTDGVAGGIILKGNGYPVAVYQSFPSAGVKIIGVSPAQTQTTAFGSVNINSIIEVFPTGLNSQGQSKRYVSDATVSTLNSSAT